MQGTSSDMLGVFSDIRDAVKTLSSVRQTVEEKHAKWFQKACQIAEKLGITVQKPRTCQVQQTPLLKRYKTTTGEISRFSWLTI